MDEEDMSRRMRLAALAASSMPGYRVVTKVLPLIPKKVPFGTSIVLSEKPQITCRPFNLVLDTPTTDLYIKNIDCGGQLLYIAPGLLPAGMFSQLIPPKNRIYLTIPTIQFSGGPIQIHVFNRNEVANYDDEDITVEGYFDCFVTER